MTLKTPERPAAPPSKQPVKDKLPPHLEVEIAGLWEKRKNQPAAPKHPHRKRRILIALLLLFLCVLLWDIYLGLQIMMPVVPNLRPNLPQGSLHHHGHGGLGLGAGAGLFQGNGPYSEDPLDLYLPPLTAEQKEHINRVLNYIYFQIHPNTKMAYSLPGDDRLLHWSVVYDDAMRAMMHIRTGDLTMAKATIDYFIENTAIEKTGWIYKGGVLHKQPGWIINIVDASESRPGGRGIEHIAHTGPNAFVGIASVHLYNATGDKKYLEYARNRWRLLRSIQNDDKNDPNYGGIRMGPMGNPENPQEQRLDFKRENPSWYSFYNGEHAADYRAFSLLMAEVDPEFAADYHHAADLIAIWDKKIYDKKEHLFYIGTTEVAYFDKNIGQAVQPGLIPMHPLDTTALKISEYGVDGLEQFENNAAEKIRKAIETHYKVTVTKRGEKTPIHGYDFVTDEDRDKIILYEEEGPQEDVKVKRGVGREPMMSDEWSTWVAMSDLKLARDFIAKGQLKKAKGYIESYKQNAWVNGVKGAYWTSHGLAYPYAHGLPYSLNKPVGFGWNTAHRPYSLIGGVARIMGLLRFDPFHLHPASIKLNLATRRPLAKDVVATQQGLITEAEVYMTDAWYFVRAAQLGGDDAELKWKMAIDSVEKLSKDHPDWVREAEIQNITAMNTEEKFPLWGRDSVTIRDLEPLYRKYWALYDVGTAEYIRFMGYSELSKIAKKKNDLPLAAAYKKIASESATSLITRFYYSQAYDERGWMWQPVNSLFQYLGFYNYTPYEYLTKLSAQPEVLNNVLQAIRDN